MPGYVGPKFAKKASDEDILAMADLKDRNMLEFTIDMLKL